MRIVFMGTPEFAVPALEKLVENHYEISAVVTQPDRPVGRGRALAPSPVKAFAVSHQLPVLQPESLKKPGIDGKLRTLRPDVIIVVAFGQLLPKQVLEIPPLGCLNVHPSLLPKYRGPSPVAGAILAGESKTGVTIMLMDEGWDTGPILAQRPVAILPDDTTGSLEKKLSLVGAELLIDVLPRWAAGQIKPQPQNPNQATYTKPITKNDGRIDWRMPADELALRCRAFNPWPSCFTFFGGKLLKILRARPYLKWRPEDVVAEALVPGKVIEVQVPNGAGGEKAIGVVTGRGVLLLQEVQLEGGRPMPIEQFVRGQRGFVGSVLS